MQFYTATCVVGANTWTDRGLTDYGVSLLVNAVYKAGGTIVVRPM